MNTARSATGNQPIAARPGSSFTAVTRAFESGAALLGASVVGNGLNYFFMLFLARQLGMEHFGLYALGVTIFNTVLLIAYAGLDTGVIKFVSSFIAQGGEEDARRVIVVALVLVTVIGVGAGLGFGLFAAPLSSELYQKPGLELVLQCFALAIPFALLGGLMLAALQALHTVRYIVALKYLWEPLGKWLVAGFAIWAGWGIGGVVLGCAAVFGVTAALAGFALLRRGYLRLADVRRLRRKDVHLLAAYAAPLLAANLFGVIAPRADIMMLGYWVTVEDVGVYLAAFQTAAALALILGAFDVVFAPMISQAWAAQDRQSLEAQYKMIHRLAFTVTMPLCVLLMLFSGEVLRAFGSGFSAGGTILAVLAVGHLANASSGCANTVLLMSGASRVVLLNTVLYGLVLMGATAAMIPLWGTLGAAVAASACFVLLNGLRVAEVWRLYRMLPWTPSILKPLAAGISMGLMIWLLKPHLDTQVYLPLALASCGLYLGILLVARVEDDDALILTSWAARVRTAAGWAR